MSFALLLELDLIAAKLDAQCGSGWVGMQGQCKRATREDLIAKVANKTLHREPFTGTDEASFMKELAGRDKLIDKLKTFVGKRWTATGGRDRKADGQTRAMITLEQGKDPGYGLITKTNAQGRPTGFLSYKPGNGSHVILQSVGSDQTEKGSGRAMFSELAAYAIKNNKGIEVTAFEDAIPFYEKMGMKLQKGSLGKSLDLSMSADEVRAKYGKKTDSVALQRIRGRRF